MSTLPELVHDGMPCDSTVCLSPTHYVCTENTHGDSHYLRPRGGVEVCQYCGRTDAELSAAIKADRT